MLRFIVPIAATVLVAGCATKADKLMQEDAQAVTVTFSSKSAKDGLIGYAPSTVRAVVDEAASNSGRGGTEDIAADCTLSADGFSAAFTTPARINMPSYGDVEKPVTLSCTYGDKTKEDTFEVVNLSLRARQGNAAAVGLLLSPLGGAIMAGVGAGDKEEDAFGYTEMTLNF